MGTATSNKTGKPNWIVKLIASGIIFSVLLVLTVILAELVCRQIPEFRRAGFEYDWNLVYRLKRNLTATKGYAMGKYPDRKPFQLTFNELGFRKDAFHYDPTVDQARIMVLGDSYTAGLDYPANEIFTNLIYDQFKNAGNEVQIMNVSCPAWAYDQYYTYWKTEGYKLEPDIVLLMVSPNDLREAYNKKIIQLDSVGNLKKKPALFPENERNGWRLACKSSFYQFLQQKIFDTKYGDFFRVFHFYPVNYGKEDKTNWDLPIFLKDPFEEVEASFELADKLVVELNKECKAKETKLMMSIIPTKTEFDGTLDTLKYESGKIARFTQEIADRENIPFLNLYQILSATENPNRIFMNWEFHFNAEGHQFVAEKLYPFLEKEIQIHQ